MVDPSSAVSVEEGGPENAFWQIGVMKPDLSLHYIVLPKVVFRCRAIEYEWQLNAQFDEVMEHVMHALLFSRDCLTDGDCDPAWQAGYHTEIEDLGEVSERLFTAETIEDAREADLIRVEDVKENTLWIPADSFKQGNSALHNRLWGARNVDHPAVAGLRDTVLAERRIIRKREDGVPLPQRPKLLKEGKSK